jgi:hypothetical protein
MALCAFPSTYLFFAPHIQPSLVSVVDPSTGSLVISGLLCFTRSTTIYPIISHLRVSLWLASLLWELTLLYSTYSDYDQAELLERIHEMEAAFKASERGKCLTA